jgi:DNA-binding NarL/FixJ family response regulator
MALPITCTESGPALRVIVVDDAEAIADGIARLLTKHPKLKVLATGGNGREAVALATELAPDLVVLDIHMPLMNGFEAAEVIRRLQPDTRILMVSLDGALRTRAEAFARGAHGFVPKLSMHRELMGEVSRLFPSLLEPSSAQALPGCSTHRP